MVLFSGALDGLDGSMARLRKLPVEFGAFADSVTDRYSELALFGGLLYYYLRQDDWQTAVGVYLAVSGSVLVSYIRARAGAVGMDTKVGHRQPLRALYRAGGHPAVQHPADRHLDHCRISPYNRLAAHLRCAPASQRKKSDPLSMRLLWKSLAPVSEFGKVSIHFYGVILMLGAVAGAVLADREARRRKFNPDLVWDALIWLLIGGVVGARLWHVLTPPPSMVAKGITPCTTSPTHWT